MYTLMRKHISIHNSSGITHFDVCSAFDLHPRGIDSRGLANEKKFLIRPSVYSLRAREVYNLSARKRFDSGSRAASPDKADGEIMPSSSSSSSVPAFEWRFDAGSFTQDYGLYRTGTKRRPRRRLTVRSMDSRMDRSPLLRSIARANPSFVSHSSRAPRTRPGRAGCYRSAGTRRCVHVYTYIYIYIYIYVRVYMYVCIYVGARGRPKRSAFARKRAAA